MKKKKKKKEKGPSAVTRRKKEKEEEEGIRCYVSHFSMLPGVCQWQTAALGDVTELGKKKILAWLAEGFQILHTDIR